MSDLHTADYAGAAGSGSYDDVGGARSGSGSTTGEKESGGIGISSGGSDNVGSNNSNAPGRGSGPSGQTPTNSARGGARRGARRGGQRGSAGSETSRTDQGGAATSTPRRNLQQQQQQQRIHNPTVDPARVVKRPIPETRNTRQFQLLQLQRRFNLKGEDGTNTKTDYTINLVPSDPEFPYAVDSLTFVLTVPLGYGAAGSDGKADGDTAASDGDNHPSIKILNDDIPVGFKINIENGFRDIVKHASKTTTLLDMVNTLDKRLESFLATEKASTIKIIPNAPNRTSASDSSASRNITSNLGTTKPNVVVQPAAYFEQPVPTKTQYKPSYTPDEIAAAAAKRAQDVRQLEARLGRMDVFSKTEAPDGEIIYTVPLEARRKDLLPVPLLTLRSVILRVPRLFNLEPCVITISGMGITRDISKPLERKFTKQVKANPTWTLMAHLNALAANLHVMATEAMEEEAKTDAEKRKQEEEKMLVEDLENKAIIDDNDTRQLATGKDTVLDDKEHIVVIPRPPEWSLAREGEGSETDTDTEDDSDYEYSENSENDEEQKDAGMPDSRERGTALSFPGIQMPGIQLLEVLFINVTIKCNKCKTTVDVKQIRPGGKPRFDRCDKCSSIYGIGFRMEPVHQFSNRAGFFDLAGCTITDILPSNFLPHCASCDTPLSAPGIANLVPGQTLTTNCRQCHLKMSLFIPEMKLLRISQDDDATLEAPHGSLPVKKAKKETRLVAGTELPNRGKCVHYRKSTRWFRFSCCLKVYPCDKCHDEQQPHPAEHANRMICGRCSREQNYKPNDCAYCGHEFMRKSTGYWEGGKGTRDKKLLRRNDPRKYKRVRKPVPEK